MRYTPRDKTRRAATAGVAALLSTALLAACGDNGGQGATDSGDITLTVGVFGQFGLEEAELYDEYERLNPHITIDQTSTQENADYYAALLTRLPTGSGLMDIQAVEVANIYEITNELSQYFVDFNDFDEVDTSHFHDWKIAQSTDESGKVVGLGTDSGPMGICYRSDLFEEAGLPTDREEVSALWEGDWEAYLAAGEEFAASGVDAAWVDAAGGLFNGVVNTFPERYYNESGELTYQESEGVSYAWEIAMDAVEADLTGKHELFTSSWDQGMANGDFATLTCPPWMLGYIEDKSGEQGVGSWDLARAPEPGNWGGSFLAVTEASQHQEEAVKLVNWLTAPEQQAKLFTERGSYPSSAAAAEQPEVLDATHGYFGDAPIGEFYHDAARSIPTLALGPRDQVIQEALAKGLLAAEQNQLDRETAWRDAVASIENALDD